MANEVEDKNSWREQKPRDHMANERTFLAWIRTSIGIMAFGFVVEKFALFTNQISSLLSQSNINLPKSLPHPGYHPYEKYSNLFGILLVILGALICLLAYFKYNSNEIQIENQTYKPSTLLNIMLTLSVLLIGLFLAIYLVHHI